MRSLLLICYTLTLSSAFGQIKNISPTDAFPLELSAEGEKEFDQDSKALDAISKKLSQGIKPEALPPAEKEVLERVDVAKEGYWDIIGSGCSWYCGGGPKEVTASSSLASQNDNTYTSENAHDLSYKTAWVEGVKGYGIGEFLSYTFAAESPRINKIIVVNGYVKSEAAWQNNSRVKKLKMYLNNKPYAMLNLKDERSEQHFEIDPIGNSDREHFDKLKALPDWTLKFEILEVYPGAKYDDVAITEIYFDGLDVHCFAKGTNITMADGSYKKIESLQVGDLVMTFNLQTNQTEPSAIDGLQKIDHHNLVKYVFENGNEIIATQDHPFLIKQKGWASLKPKQSRQYKGFANIDTIQVNDQFKIIDKHQNMSLLKLIKIELLVGHQETYTISKLKNGSTFMANGFVVGTEELENTPLALLNE